MTPKTWRHIHAALTIVWSIAIIPSLLLWSESLLWIVFMSAWANVAGHFSAWQAARAEEHEQEMARSDRPVNHYD